MLCLRCDTIFVDYFVNHQYGPWYIPKSWIKQHGKATARACALCRHFNENFGSNPYRLGVGSELVIRGIEGTVAKFSAIPVSGPDRKEHQIYSQYMFEIYEVGRFAYNDIETDVENVTGLPRDLPAKVSDDLCFALVKRWIHECNTSHARCSARPASPLPTRVIDVCSDGENPRLIDGHGMTGSYATLSHRWGDNVDFVTTEENLQQHQDGIDLESLPKTFREAIVTCRKVGIPFLWIDAICIIQNQESREDWAKEAPLMANVYSNSLLTISATFARDSHEGLFTQVNRSASATNISDWPFAENIKFGIRETSTNWCEFVSQMKWSPLTKRGWIFQERILSNATLHFGDGQLFWECRSRVDSEKYSHHGSFFQALTQSHGKMMHDLKAFVKDNNTHVGNHWRFLVQEYCRLDLTNKSDRLAACLGIAATLQGFWEAKFMSGLWDSSLHLDLLWHFPYTSLRDTMDMGFDTTSTRYEGVSPELDLTKLRTPSWSWTSVDYEIRYNFHHSLPRATFQFVDYCVKKPYGYEGQSISNTAILTLRGKVLRVMMQPLHKDLKVVDETKRLRQIVFIDQPEAPTRKVAGGCLLDPGMDVDGLVHLFGVAAQHEYPSIHWFLLVREIHRGDEVYFERLGFGSGKMHNSDRGDDTPLFSALKESHDTVIQLI